MIVLRGPLFGQTGYAVIARGLAKGLYQICPDELVVQPLAWATQQDMYVDETMMEILSKCGETRSRVLLGDRADTMICIQLPKDVTQAPIMPRTFLYTMLETDLIPPQWVQIINSMTKGALVPCHGNVKSFKASGVQNVFALPPSLDTDVFRPDRSESHEDSFVLENRNKFNIMTSSQVGPRKNIKGLVEAYCDVFGDNPDVTLFVKIHGQGASTVEMFDLAKELKRIRTNSSAKIVMLYDTVPPVVLADIYRQMDLYVNASFGESWDYPRFESLMCGVPAIGTVFNGPEMYMPKDFVVAHNMEHVVKTMPPNDIYMSHMQWARPDSIDLRRKLYQAYDEKNRFKDIAMKQCKLLHERSSWRKAAQALLGLIDNCKMEELIYEGVNNNSDPVIKQSKKNKGQKKRQR